MLVGYAEHLPRRKIDIENMEQSANIFLKTREYVIHSNSRNIDGLWIASPPYYKLSTETDFEEVFKAIKDALNSTKHSLPRLSITDLADDAYLKALKFKSLRDLYKDARLSIIVLKDNMLSILPTKKLGVAKGFSHLNAQIVHVSINSNIDEIKKAFSKAFSKCEG